MDGPENLFGLGEEAVDGETEGGREGLRFRQIHLESSRIAIRHKTQLDLLKPHPAPTATVYRCKSIEVSVYHLVILPHKT